MSAALSCMYVCMRECKYNKDVFSIVMNESMLEPVINGMFKRPRNEM